MEKQGLHKLSYYIPLDTDVKTLIKAINLRLKAQQIQANIIWSIDEQAQIGLLDILPLGANKQLAIAFLMDQQNFTLQNTLFSGDSGNDLDVLLSPIPSILVANANPEFKKQIQEKANQLGLSDTIYIAKGLDLTLNGNYSAGIIEGIYYYFPESKHTLKIV
jgi:hydroxymethylpyrimidine pyrophosphatase-like HAD family hydrolase